MTTSQHGPAPTPVSLTVQLARHRHPAVGRNKIYAAIATGALPAVRVGKRLAIGTMDMDAWVASGCPLVRREVGGSDAS